MNSQVLGVGWYRFRVTLRRRWPGYVALALLIGLIGGIAMASIAGARRTQSSYPKFLSRSRASDLEVSTFGGTQNPTANNAAFTLTTPQLRGLADVTRVEHLVILTMAPLSGDGAANVAEVGNLLLLGSADGEFFDQDRLAVVNGRLANPARSDEFVTTAQGAAILGVRVGQSVTFGEYTAAQAASPKYGSPSVAPHVRVTARLVGIVELGSQIVADDIDLTSTPLAVFTPAFADPVLGDAQASIYALKLAHGAGDVAAVEENIVHRLPPGSVYQFHAGSIIEARVQRAIKPEAIALGVFGAIAAVAALAIAGLAISRQLNAGGQDLAVLRALGAAPAATAAEGLIGVLGALGLGALVAGCVAVALSPLTPIGPVRPVYPARGIAADWTVLGAGVAVLVVALAAVAIAVAYRAAPHRASHRRVAATSGSSAARAAAGAGLPAPGVVGVRFALEPGAGRTAVPVRSALVGAALAVVTVVATLTFGSGLHTLVSRPNLYGWNWDYALNPSDVVPNQLLPLLDHDPNVAAWNGVNPETIEIDGQTVPMILEKPGSDPNPPILAGHPLETDAQIVLGAATLGQLHKHIGDTVAVSYGAPQDAPVYLPPTKLVIVGTATFPAVGYNSFIADHTSMGTGALIPQGIISAAFQKASQSPDPVLDGPNMVWVRLRPGVPAAAGRADLQRIADAANKVLAADPNSGGSTVAVIGVQRPAEIQNYRSMGATPVVLAGGLALGAVVALGLTLTASVRRRRRDLALLKALGFTRRQIAATVAWQASVAAVIGVVVGVPLGIALGRQLWVLFARSIDVVPQPSVPVVSVLLVALAALLLANAVAAIPGRVAGRTPTALVLRAE